MDPVSDTASFTASVNGHGPGHGLGQVYHRNPACGLVFFFDMLRISLFLGLDGPFEPAIPHRLQQHFSPFAAELAAARTACPRSDRLCNSLSFLICVAYLGFLRVRRTRRKRPRAMKIEIHTADLGMQIICYNLNGNML